MRTYAIYNSAAVGSASFPQLGIYQAGAASLVRPRIFEFLISSSATPADQASRFTVNRFTTAAPTGGGAITTVVYDFADPASTLTGYGSATGGCTLSTQLMTVSVNLRATFRWVSVPGREVVVPVTQYAGAGLVSAAQSAAYNEDLTLIWDE